MSPKLIKKPGTSDLSTKFKVVSWITLVTAKKDNPPTDTFFGIFQCNEYGSSLQYVLTSPNCWYTRVNTSVIYYPKQRYQKRRMSLPCCVYCNQPIKITKLHQLSQNHQTLDLKKSNLNRQIIRCGSWQAVNHFYFKFNCVVACFILSPWQQGGHVLLRAVSHHSVQTGIGFIWKMIAQWLIEVLGKTKENKNNKYI